MYPHGMVEVGMKILNGMRDLDQSIDLDCCPKKSLDDVANPVDSSLGSSQLDSDCRHFEWTGL